MLATQNASETKKENKLHSNYLVFLLLFFSLYHAKFHLQRALDVIEID